MSQVTAEMVQELRGRTGVAIGKCKQALEEAKGDMELAIANLRKAGIAGAVKKEGRETKEGAILVGQSGNQIALVEANAETDFVVKNAFFQQFAQDAAQQVADSGVESVEALMAAQWAKDKSLTMDQYRAVTMQKLGENIQIRRLMLLKKEPNSSVGIYSHMGGKIVCLVVLSGAEGQEELAREVAMHVAAEAPEYLRPDDVPAAVKASEEDVARGQVKGKPENVIQKILEGKMKAFYEQCCLESQKFVRDPSVTVAEYVQQRGKAAGKPLQIARFVRWAVSQ
jgi:elongation factor Ts